MPTYDYVCDACEHELHAKLVMACIMIDTGFPQAFGPGSLHESNIARVVNEPLGIRVLEINPHRQREAS